MSHPMTPPRELLSKWEDEILKRYENVDVQLLNAYQAGADAELDACCGWIESQSGLGALSFIPEVRATFRCQVSDQLRSARRPAPPPTTQQQALNACSTALAAGRLSPDEASIIRLALEAQS